MTGVKEHIYFQGGAKTVCTSAVLASFGISPDSYHYSGQHEQRASILRRHGWAVRSRASAFKGCTTVGSLRTAIAKRTQRRLDPTGTMYMLRLRYGRARHAVLLDETGATVVDTDPRARDRRRVVSVHAVFRRGSHV